MSDFMWYDEVNPVEKAQKTAKAVEAVRNELTERGIIAYVMNADSLPEAEQRLANREVDATINDVVERYMPEDEGAKARLVSSIFKQFEAEKEDKMPMKDGRPAFVSEEEAEEAEDDSDSDEDDEDDEDDDDDDKKKRKSDDDDEDEDSEDEEDSSTKEAAVKESFDFMNLNDVLDAGQMLKPLVWAGGLGGPAAWAAQRAVKKNRQKQDATLEIDDTEEMETRKAGVKPRKIMDTVVDNVLPDAMKLEYYMKQQEKNQVDQASAGARGMIVDQRVKRLKDKVVGPSQSTAATQFVAPYELQDDEDHHHTGLEDIER